MQTENTGVEREEATRLGVANLLRSLGRLDAGTGGDAKLYASTYGVMLSRQVGLLQSVHRMLAGVMPAMGEGEGPRPKLVPATEQRQAVQYLLGEGEASLEPYAAPAVVERVAVYGGYRAIDRQQTAIVTAMMTGSTVALLESQRRSDPTAYSSLDFGRDITAAVWGDLKASNPTRRALQRGYIEAAKELLTAWAKGGADEKKQSELLQSQVPMSSAVARAIVESGDDTVFIPWLHAALPQLKTRLEAASQRQRRGRPPALRRHGVARGAAAEDRHALTCCKPEPAAAGHPVKDIPMNRIVTLSLALMAPAVWASELASLIDLPVAGTALIPKSQYRDAALRAARTDPPVDVALSVVGPFEGARQLIVQVNEGAESPSVSRLTVIRDGLLDDAVRTERWDIALTRTAAGTWEIREVAKAWRCWRGAMTAGFAARPCP